MKRPASASTAPRKALLFGRRTDLPSKGSACPICGRHLGGDQAVVKLFGGASLLEEDGEAYGPADSMLGFLELSWDLSPSKGDGFLHAFLPIADRVQGGQFSIAVCSPQCLGRLFAGWVKDLRLAVKEERSNVKRSQGT
jgi:hypothetical protein